MTPTQLVVEQLNAYNARDLERFMACFADDVRTIRLPDLAVTLDGKAAFAEFYATQRFNHSGLRAELVNRIVLGNKVVDHERIHGIAPQPIEMAVVFVVEQDLIQTFFSLPPK